MILLALVRTAVRDGVITRTWDCLYMQHERSGCFEEYKSGMYTWPVSIHISGCVPRRIQMSYVVPRLQKYCTATHRAPPELVLTCCIFFLLIRRCCLSCTNDFTDCHDFTAEAHPLNHARQLFASSLYCLLLLSLLKFNLKIHCTRCRRHLGNSRTLE